MAEPVTAVAVGRTVIAARSSAALPTVPAEPAGNRGPAGAPRAPGAAAGPSSRLRTGRYGEDLAATYLEDIGWKVLERNWRPEHGLRGELDIIARDDTDPENPWTVVIEVRTRVGRQRGSALASVDARKVARLRALTGAWCRQRGRLGSRVRIDVVALTLDAQALRHWPVVTCTDVDLRPLGAQVVWLRGVQ